MGLSLFNKPPLHICTPTMWAEQCALSQRTAHRGQPVANFCTASERSGIAPVRIHLDMEKRTACPHPRRPFVDGQRIFLDLGVC